MAHARLHIICGNCGCNDMFEYEIVKGADASEQDAVWLWCRNCGTLHNIGDNAKEHVERYIPKKGESRDDFIKKLNFLSDLRIRDLTSLDMEQINKIKEVFGD